MAGALFKVAIDGNGRMNTEAERICIDVTTRVAFHEFDGNS